MYCNSSLIKSNTGNFSKFNRTDQVKKFILPKYFSCAFCIIISRNHRSKSFKNLHSLKCHVLKQHKDFHDINTGLTNEKLLELIINAEEVLFWRVIS